MMSRNTRLTLVQPKRHTMFVMHLIIIIIIFTPFKNEREKNIPYWFSVCVILKEKYWSPALSVSHNSPKIANKEARPWNRPTPVAWWETLSQTPLNSGVVRPLKKGSYSSFSKLFTSLLPGIKMKLFGLKQIFPPHPASHSLLICPRHKLVKISLSKIRGEFPHL